LGRPKTMGVRLSGKGIGRSFRCVFRRSPGDARETASARGVWPDQSSRVARRFPCYRSDEGSCPCHLPQLRECRVPGCKREPVHSPSARAWINLCRFDMPPVDLKALASADVDYLVRNTWMGATDPSLLVDCSISFASDLLIVEAITSESCWQWLVGMAFLTP